MNECVNQFDRGVLIKEKKHPGWLNICLFILINAMRSKNLAIITTTHIQLAMRERRVSEWIPDC